ncbi:Phage tail fiber repeat protein [compost metagenome]
MAKTDWSINNVVRPQDMNDIGAEINQLRDDVDHIEVPPASTTKAGIVQLNDATNSPSTTQAGTANAVKKAYERADAAFTAGNERKQQVVDVLIAKGVTASTSESWDSLIAKLMAIVKAMGNATVADVLAPKTFSNASGNSFVGAIPSKGTATITPSTANQTIAAGQYLSGIQTILGDPDLVAGNLPKDVNIFGVVGALERMTTAEKQALAAEITAKGVPASVADSNALLAQKIGQIITGKRFTSGTVTSDFQSNLVIPFSSWLVKFGLAWNSRTTPYLFAGRIYDGRNYGNIIGDSATNGGRLQDQTNTVYPGSVLFSGNIFSPVGSSWEYILYEG